MEKKRVLLIPFCIAALLFDETRAVDQRLAALGQPLPQFNDRQSLTFQEPDLEKFPCLGLAFKACEVGGTLPAVLNASNEAAVNAFLNRSLGFTEIAAVVGRTWHRVAGRMQPMQTRLWPRRNERNCLRQKGASKGGRVPRSECTIVSCVES